MQLLKGTSLGILLLGLTVNAALAAPVPVATYLFNNNTNAQEAGIPALSVILDSSTASSAFVSDTPFGSSRTVLQLTGDKSVNPIKDAGLQFNDSGGQLPSTTYSAEIVFEFTDSSAASRFRAIINSNNRTVDQGFYVSQSNVLNVFPNTSGTTAFNVNQYYDVVLTNAGGTVNAYLNGHPELTISTAVMNIGSANVLDFLVDDFAMSGNPQEFSNSKVAMIRLFDIALSASDVSTLNNNGNPFPVPEPSTALLLSVGVAGLATRRGHVRGASRGECAFL